MRTNSTERGWNRTHDLLWCLNQCTMMLPRVQRIKTKKRKSPNRTWHSKCCISLSQLDKLEKNPWLQHYRKFIFGIKPIPRLSCNPERRLNDLCPHVSMFNKFFTVNDWSRCKTDEVHTPNSGFFWRENETRIIMKV